VDYERLSVKQSFEIHKGRTLMSNDTAFVATFNFQDSSISFCTLPVVNGQLIDIGETTSVNDFEEAGCDSVIEMLESNEVPSDELRSDLEERLRLRMAHFDLCHPNVPLKEKQRVAS
jgi:hypothetical protein